MTDYLLDANVFIQVTNLHYGFDFCPAFWDWLVEQHGVGKVACIEKLAHEPHVGSDQLATSAETRGDDFFQRPDGAAVPALRTFSDWASGYGYRPTAIATFLQVANYLLVAHALGRGCTLVTHEMPADTISEIKIPNPRIGPSLRSISPCQMVRCERERIVLAPDRGIA